MSSYIYDVECNGFLETVTKIHSLVLKDIDTLEVFSYADQPGYPSIDEGLEKLKAAELRIGHNIIKFDDAVLAKVKDVQLDPYAVYDTLVMSRLIHSNINEADTIQRLPHGMQGSHSLEAWGYRLGKNKVQYNGGFDEWSKDMQDYCEGDIETNYHLYNKLKDADYSETAVNLEHELAVLIAKTERNGFPFNVQAAGALYTKLASERDAIKRQLQNLFEPWRVVDKIFTPKKDNAKLGYHKGIPVTKWKTVTFNPSSRQHIAYNLTKKYGWKPKEFTPSGQAKIDETVLSRLPFHEAKSLARSFMLDKRIGQLAEGNQAWLTAEVNGKIHCSYNTNGAITGRPTCSHPNLQQVPANNNLVPYGRECRELFHAPPGRIMLGSDMSGLELRCLAHYMADFDKGAYADQVVNGDVHTLNMESAGLTSRNDAKTFAYAFLYGAGDAKIGSIVGGTARDGKDLKERFLAKTPALAALKSRVTSAARKGYLKGIDGRHIPVRHEHAALNTLLQGAGAVLCKTWLCLIEEGLKSKGLEHSNSGDFAFLAWIHDEVQLAIKPELEMTIGNVCKDMAIEAGAHYGFKCPTAAEYQTGNTWAETH